MIASQQDMIVLEDHDTKPETFHHRIAAVWAHVHDLAIAKYGESETGKFFVGANGYKHLSQLETMSCNATAAEMLAVSKKFLGVE